MSGLERDITVFSLINTAVFYAITIVLFLRARRSNLNWALAWQKSVWLLIIVFIAFPGVALARQWLDDWMRMILWTMLDIASWWVLYEAFRENVNRQYSDE